MLAAITNIFLACVLGVFFGVSGIIIASVVSRLVTYFWYEPKLLFKQYFDRKANKYYVSYFENILISALCAFCLHNLSVYFIVTNIAAWIIKAIICVLLINTVFLIRYYKSNEFLFILNKFKLLRSNAL